MFQVSLHRTPATHTHTPRGMNLNCSACRDGHNAQIPRTIAQRWDLKRDLQGGALGCHFQLRANGAKKLNGLSVANVGFQLAGKHNFHV